MLFLLSLALTVRNDSYAIDFGSFYTKSGNLSEDGNPSILFNLQTKRLTPTFLAFRTPKTYNPSLLLNSEILSHFQCEIGEDAMNLITKNSWTGTGFFPSLIGLMNSATNSLIQNLGFPFSANSTFGLLNMSSAYLHFYSKFVFGTIPQEVTVVYPSFYSVTQSTILLNLLKSAGFRSPKLISDIESIASFYVHEKIDLFRNIPQTILFIDVGATSVKSYVMEFSNTPNGIVVTQLSYGFDLSIGGSYATNSLVKHLIRELKLQNITESDRMKLFQASEKIKQQLSLLQETHQQIPNINGKDYSVTVTRNDFEEMIIDFVVNTTNIALSSRGRIPINQIELLGGSARIPKIQESLSKAFQGNQDWSFIKFDEVLTLGALYMSTNNKFVLRYKPNYRRVNMVEIVFDDKFDQKHLLWKRNVVKEFGNFTLQKKPKTAKILLSEDYKTNLTNNVIDNYEIFDDNDEEVSDFMYSFSIDSYFNLRNIKKCKNNLCKNITFKKVNEYEKQCTNFVNILSHSYSSYQIDSEIQNDLESAYFLLMNNNGTPKNEIVEIFGNEYYEQIKNEIEIIKHQLIDRDKEMNMNELKNILPKVLSFSAEFNNAQILRNKMDEFDKLINDLENVNKKINDKEIFEFIQKKKNVLINKKENFNKNKFKESAKNEIKDIENEIEEITKFKTLQKEIFADKIKTKKINNLFLRGLYNVRKLVRYALEKYKIIFRLFE